jgi:hypothetical protein
MREEDQLKMPNIAEAWLELANDAAAIDLRTGIDVRPRPPRKRVDITAFTKACRPPEVGASFDRLFGV